MNIGTLTIEMAANVARLSKDMDAARRTVERTFGSIEKDVARLKDMIGGLFAGVSATMFVGKLVDVQRQFDVLNSSLITVTGSSEAAAKEFAWIKQFASTTPYQLAEVTSAFVKMKALGLDASQKALQSYGNTASAMGKGLDQMIEAVADAATGEFERLKEFGIRANKQGEQVTLTFQGVSKTIGNSAAEITAYLQSIGENQFAGAMEERAKTLDGAISNLADTWDELFRTINEEQAGGLIYDSVKLASGAIQDLITIIKALNGATQENTTQTGAMAAIQEGLAIVFETVSVLGVNVKYVLVQIGKEIGGIAAQAAAILSGNFSQAAEIRRMMVADAEAARREVDETTARILNARREAQQAGAAQQAVTQSAPAMTRALGGSSDAAKKFEEQLSKLLAKINGKESGVDSDFYSNMQLLRTAFDKGKISLEEFQAVAERYIKQQKFYQDEVKAAADAAEELRKAEEKARQEREKAIQSAEEMIDQIQFETKALQMSNVEREVAIKLRELERKGIKAGSAEYEEYARRIREAVVGKETVEASLEQQRKATKEWEKTWDQVGQSLTDALMRGFEAGDGFGKNFVKSLQNTLKTTVLKIAVQAVVSPVSSGIGQMIGIPGAGDSSSIGGLLSTGSSLANLAGGGSMAGSALLSAGAAMGGLSGGFMTGAGAALTNGAGILGNLSAGSSLIGTGTAGGIATGAGMIAPYALAALAVADAIGAFGKRGGPQQGQYGRLDASGYRSSFTMSGGDALNNPQLASAAYAQAQALFAIAGKNVADLAIEQGYKLDPQGSAAGLAYRNLILGGKTLTGGTFDGNNGAQWQGANNDAAGAAGYLAKITSSEIEALANAIDDSHLSEIVAKLKSNFGDLADGMQRYLTAQTVQKELLAAAMTSDEAAARKLADANKLLASNFERLGLAVPTTTAGFRDLIDGLDLTTQSGQDTLMAMAGAKDAFILVAEAAKQADEQQREWTDKLAVLQGRTTEQRLAREKELARITDTATQAIAQQVYALQDQAEAAEKAAAALAKHSSVINGALDAYGGLLTAMGDEKGALELAVSRANDAYDAALRSLADEIGTTSANIGQYINEHGGVRAAVEAYWTELGEANIDNADAIREKLTAFVAAYTGTLTASKALAEYAPKVVEPVVAIVDEMLSKIAEMRAKWQDRLDVLTGSTTQRAIELRDALASTTDAATQAIIRQVFALEDQEAAASAATAAIEAAAERARAIASKQRDLDIQLMEARGQSAAALAARRADALAALENEHLRSTQQQIWMAQDAAAAQEAAAKAAEEQRRVQQELVDGWKRTAESIIGTVKSLTGSMFDEAQGFAKTQADFAIASAAAKAGDQAAANSLPDLAKALVDLGKVNSVTAIDQALLTARTAGVLRDVVGGIGGRFGIEVPAFASGGSFGGGMRMVGERGPELELTGPSHIYSAGQTRDVMGDLIGELRGLREENAYLRQIIDSRLARIESNTLETSKGMHGENRAPVLVEIAPP